MKTNEIADRLFQAWQANDTPPLPSSLDGELDEDRAYLIQADYVRLRLTRDTIVGYKLGATAEPVRHSLGLEDPLSGVLFGSGKRSSGNPISLSEFGSLLIETELGFRASRIIDEPIDDEAALRTAMSSVFPVFELADTGFYGTKRSLGADLIAANSACAGFLAGTEFSSDEFEPDRQAVTLHRDGELVYTASASAPLGGQWRSLRCLVNAIVAQGYRIDPGQIFLTGALGMPQPGKAGLYRADYGPLGIVEFSLGP